MQFLTALSLELVLCSACGSTPRLNIVEPMPETHACDEYWEHPPGGGLTFESGETEIGPEHAAEIEQLISWLDSRVATVRQIVIEGASDCCNEHAPVEGQRRADAVAGRLAQRFGGIQVGAVWSSTRDCHLGCARVEAERRALRYARVAIVRRDEECQARR
jgi:hypothetical protein